MEKSSFHFSLLCFFRLKLSNLLHFVQCQSLSLLRFGQTVHCPYYNFVDEDGSWLSVQRNCVTFWKRIPGHLRSVDISFDITRECGNIDRSELILSVHRKGHFSDVSSLCGKVEPTLNISIQYRSDTVYSKWFRGQFFLRIKWKLKLNYDL